MKRILICFVIVVLGGIVCMRAQEYRLGVEVGVLGSRPTSYTDAVKPAYDAGLRVEFSPWKLSKGFFFSSGLGIVMKPWGADFRWDDPLSDGEICFIDYANPTYLRLPVLAGYRWRLSDKIAFSLEGGPSIGLGIFGKMKTGYHNPESLNDGYTIYSANVFKDWWGYNRLAIDFNLRLGTMIGEHCQVSAIYSIGINEANDIGFHNQTFGISAAYMF